MASLIQQRFAIDRIRVRALWMIWGGAAMLAAGGSIALAGGFRPPSWAVLGIWLLVLLRGVAQLREHGRTVREFEAKNGPGAGLQTSVTD